MADFYSRKGKAMEETREILKSFRGRRQGLSVKWLRSYINGKYFMTKPVTDVVQEFIDTNKFILDEDWLEPTGWVKGGDESAPESTEKRKITHIEGISIGEPMERDE